MVDLLIIHDFIGEDNECQLCKCGLLSLWFSDIGWGVENYGTDPDIEVEITPQDYAKGVDTQLERAILEIMNSLQSNPPLLPDMSGQPSRALPRLPNL